MRALREKKVSGEWGMPDAEYIEGMRDTDVPFLSESVS